jgi:hypothetical protein
MKNLAMHRKLMKGEAIDLSNNEISNGEYEVIDFIEDMDYCDQKKEEWIWSIGRHHITKKIYASTDTKFYMNPEYECLWLR